jgi:hypothetical protein
MHRAEKPFDLVHLDLWTSPIVSVSGYKYYLVILDDCTHYLWTFPLKLKSDTFTTLSHFFAYVSTQFGCTVKAIQCDNGREFDNSSTHTFLLMKGVLLRMSCPYTSPQNGKAERIIRSINNVIRTLLFQANLPGRYWAEGLHTATYLLTRLPTKTIQAACPHMALFGSPPSYAHLRVFGCTCYPNTSTTPHKFSPRSTRCVFLGYSSDHKGYRCLDLSTNRQIVSRHVVFDEASFPLAASPHLTDLDFLCESGSSVNPIRTPVTTAGTTTAAACQPAPVVPPDFTPRVTPLTAPAVPLGFQPREVSRTSAAPHAAPDSTAAPRAAPLSSSAPCAVYEGPPPREWPASPTASRQ